MSTKTREGIYTTESVALAWRVLRSLEGRAALDEGWGLALWEYIATHGREPATSEIADLRKSAKRVRKARETWPACARAAHERREQKLRDGVLGSPRVKENVS